MKDGKNMIPSLFQNSSIIHIDVKSEFTISGGYY